MKGIKNIARASKKATFIKPVKVYYNDETDSLNTSGKGWGLMELYKEHSEEEVKRAAIKYLSL